jgi:hypothetical protein
MRSQASTLLAAGLLLGAPFEAIAQQQQPLCAGGGVTYREYPERGPQVDTGRMLPVSPGGTEYGVDINSRIALLINADCIIRVLEGQPAPTPATDSLQARIDSLTSTLEVVPTAIAQVQATFDAYAALGTGPEAAAIGPFDSLLSLSARTRQRIFAALTSAAQIRLTAAGMPPDDVKSSIDAMRNAELIGGFQGYNWEIISSQLEREIEFARAELAAERPVGLYEIEVRAHLLTPDGQYPISLEDYNREATCAETRVDPIQLEIPTDEAEIYEHAKKMEAELGKVRGIGNVIVASVTADLGRVRPELEELLARARSAATPVDTAVRRLLRWGRPGELKAWLKGFGSSLLEDPAGPLVVASADTLEATAATLNADLEALRALASLREDLAGADARSAMAAILSRASGLRQLGRASALGTLQPATWTSRGELVRRFLDQIERLGPALRERVRSDPKGPVADALAARDALKAVADSLGNVSQDAIALLGRILGLPIALAATNLPEPQGLTRRRLEDDLDTEVRLKDICQRRKENNQVMVEVRILKADQQVSTRTDRFHLRFFGWRSRVAAGLAFYIREQSDVWQPGAAMSWIFTHSGWPKQKERGLGDPAGLGKIGFGLTTVNLHFDDQNAIELGIGPSLSFLNDRVVLGGGWNLQASEDKLYGFMSIRLLDVARPTH